MGVLLSKAIRKTSSGQSMKSQKSSSWNQNGLNVLVFRDTSFSAELTASIHKMIVTMIKSSLEICKKTYKTVEPRRDQSKIQAPHTTQSPTSPIRVTLPSRNLTMTFLQ
ncbi:hypothetical protein Dimus_009738 [Dionaea muscipula]